MNFRPCKLTRTSWYLSLRNEHDDLTEVGESTIVAHINHVEGLDASVGLIKAVQAKLL